MHKKFEDAIEQVSYRSFFNSASALFRRRFVSVSSGILTNRLWLKSQANHECDLLITFPSRIDENKIIWFLKQLLLLEPDIRISIKYHFTTGVYGFYITFTYSKLLKGAESLQLEKPIKSQFGGGFKSFIFDEFAFYDNVECEQSFLTSQERQSIGFFLLNEIKIQQRQEVSGIKFKPEQKLIQRALDKQLVKQIIPLHNKDKLNNLFQNWVLPKNILKPQPIDDIRQYFGDKTAFYFSWIEFYTKALCLPAIYGIILWFFTGKSQQQDDVIHILNSLLNIMWGTCFLVLWRRKQAELAYFWNTLDLNDNLLEDPRPKFKGQYRLSPITNKDETYYPHWKRLIFRCFVTIPVLTSNILLVALCMLLIFRFQSWIDHNVKAGNLPHLMSLTQFSPKILLAIMTTIFSDLYKKISRWLNDKENYREQSEYDKQMITKLFAFQCVNSYLSVSYIAFLTHKDTHFSQQLLAIFVIKQFWRNIKEALVPYFVANTKLSVLIKLSKKERDRYEDKKELNKKLKQILDEWECSQDKTETKLLNTQNSETYDYSTQAVDKTLTDHSFEELHRKPSLATFETLTLSQAEIECSQPKFPDLYEDYLEMIMQFGYIIFFSSKFPLAAFFSLLNNIVEIRTDAFKICMIYQRPFTQRVKDIGHWQNVLELMIIAAVIVNCTLCCVKGIFRRILPMPFAAEIFILVLIEHVLILICQLIRSSVEKTPYWVRVEKAKLEYRRRDALKKLECDNLRFKDEEQQECRTTSNVINN